MMVDEKGEEEETRVSEREGGEIEQMDHLYQSFINTPGAYCY